MNASASAHPAVDQAVTYRPGWLWFGLWAFLAVSTVRTAVDVIMGGALSAGVGVEGLIQRGLGWAMVGIAVIVTSVVVGLMIFYASSSARLEGTTLVVRRFRTRRIDLSTATVSLTARHGLLARDATHPKGVLLPLVVVLRGVLPADELTALAHALPPSPTAGALLDLATNREARRWAGRSTRIFKVTVGIFLAIGALTFLSLGVLELAW